MKNRKTSFVRKVLFCFKDFLYCQWQLYYHYFSVDKLKYIFFGYGVTIILFGGPQGYGLKCLINAVGVINLSRIHNASCLRVTPQCVSGFFSLWYFFLFFLLFFSSCYYFFPSRHVPEEVLFARVSPACISVWLLLSSWLFSVLDNTTTTKATQKDMPDAHAHAIPLQVRDRRKKEKEKKEEKKKKKKRNKIKII